MNRWYLFSVMAVVATAVSAGVVQPATVEVTVNEDGSGFAQGDMVSARFSDNDVDVMGCGTRTFDDGAGVAFRFGFCQATDSDGESGFCSIIDSELIDAMQALADFSFVTFSWNADGECIRVGNSTQSFYIPSRVDKKTKSNNGKNEN